MDNIYSIFYTGQQNPFGIGTWDSKPKKLKHSSSQPFISNQAKSLPPILSEQIPNEKNNFNYTQISNNNKNQIKLPIIDSRPTSKYKSKKRRNRTNSYDESSYNYDANKNKKELSNFINDINNGIAIRLQNDNFMTQQKLKNIKNDYNEIKILLNNKIEKLEQDQQIQFDNLKYALEQGGSLKMMGAVKNTNGGNNCDLKRAEEEGIIDATRKLPKLLEDKINIINDMKRREKEDEKRLLSQVKKKINEEIKKQKEKDEIRFKREIDEIEQKRENIRQERMRLMEELQNHEIEESESEQINLNSPHNYFQNMNPQVLPPPSIPQIMSPYTFPPNMYPSLNNRNNNKDSTGELLKIFLLKKMFDDKSQTIQNTPQIQPQPQYIPPPYPPQYQQPPPQPQQPITIPQPIILQSPQTAMSPPNIIIQQERSQPQISPQIQPQIIQPQIKYKDIVITKSESIKSEKGIPFVDPLENYLKETKVKKKSYPKEKKKTTAKKTQEYEEEEDEEEEEEEEEDSTPPPIKLKLYDPDNMENTRIINITNNKDNNERIITKKKESQPKKTKTKTKTKDSKLSNKKDSKATKNSKKSTKKKDSKTTKNSKKSDIQNDNKPKDSKQSKKSSSKKPTNSKEPQKDKKKKKDEEEEEYDEEEEEEEDDEEEEEEEDDEEEEEEEDDEEEGEEKKNEGNQRIIKK